MKKLYSRIIVLAIFGLVSGSAFSQQIDSTLLNYQDIFPKEKIHIHFDRAAYNKGETIWYKLYLLTGTDLSGLSQNVYVEWYDAAGKMIVQTVAPLFQATAKGSFDVPGNYKGDFLRVKAYTRWMLNDDSAFLYKKDLIINAGTSEKSKSVPVVIRTKVETFPEGGFLIQGISKRVAFKAVNQYGTPVFIKGTVTDGKNNILDTLRVKHDGMGTFSLLPKPGESYKLQWIDENGTKGTTPVVVEKAQGASLSVTANMEKAAVMIERTKDAGENFKQLNLLIHMNQLLYYKVSIKMTDKLIQTAQIPIEEMPTGILQVSLFTSDWIPVAERIIFVNNRLHEFTAKLTTPQVSLEKRGKNAIEIYVPDTAFANMSLAVTDASIDIPEQNTIYSDLLLSSDIKGKVYNPAYYFKSDADSIASHLDLVMMTNGWRRYDWEKIKAGILPKLTYPRETDFLKIKGKVFGSATGLTTQPLQLNFMIMAKDSSKQFMTTPVQRDGNFEIPGVFFYDTVRVYYTFNNNKKLSDLMQVVIENGLLKQTAKTITYDARDPRINWNDSLAKLKMNYFLEEQEKMRKLAASTTLQEVTVKTKIKNPLQLLEERYTSGMFTGGDGYSFDLTDNKALGSFDILTYLQGRVAGLQITGTGGQVTLNWRGSTPALFLNEVNTDVSMIQNIPISDIALVKVLRPPFFGAPGGGGGGAIAIYTKKGGDAKSAGTDAKGMENTILGGYSRFKEFYSPSYDKPNASFEADVRSTLYWNPYVLTNKRNPRVRLEFYNNDISKKLQIVMEGVNSNGKLSRIVKILE